MIVPGRYTVRKQRLKAVNIQGFPGSGKTTLMAVLVIALCEVADMNVLWTAVNVNAVREGGLRIAHLLEDAPIEIRNKYIRLLSKREEPRCWLDIAFSDRRRIIGHSLQQKVILMTEDGFVIEHSFAYTQLMIKADISLKDESQQAGTPAHAFQLGFVVESGIAVAVGDPEQTKLPVDPRNQELKRLVGEIEKRDPGIRCKSLVWVPSTNGNWSEQFCDFLSLVHSQDTDVVVHRGRGALAAIFDFVVNGQEIIDPGNVNIAALRESAPPQLTLPVSFRLPSFLYALIVAAGYQHLVQYTDETGSTPATIRLGELPCREHKSLEHVCPDWAQVVWIQPYGYCCNRTFRDTVESHMNNVLAILAHMCIQRKTQYMVHLQLGVVVAQRVLFVELIKHFEKQKPDGEFSMAKRQQESFTTDLKLSMSDNIAIAMGKSDNNICEGDILFVLTKAPWIVRDFIGISTAMSAVGSEKLDVLYYKIRPGPFVDKKDQNIVGHSRCRGHLYLYCDFNRARGFAARMAAMVIRCCPVVYWSAWGNVSVDFRFQRFTADFKAGVSECPVHGPAMLHSTDVSRLLLDASTAWSKKPFCIAVKVVSEAGVEAKLLFARPFLSNVGTSPKVPAEYRLDRWTIWSWESDSPDREVEHWSLRPRHGYWYLCCRQRMHRDYVLAHVSYDVVQTSRSFQMHVHQSDPVTVQTVDVCIMPSFVFPTCERFSTDDILEIMSKTKATPVVLDRSEAAWNTDDFDGNGADISSDDDDGDEFLHQQFQQQDDANGESSFCQASMDAHQRADEAYGQLSHGVKSRLNEDQAGQIYHYSPEKPWCLLTFAVQDFTRPMHKAKLMQLFDKAFRASGQFLDRPICVDSVIRQVSNEDGTTSHHLGDGDLLRCLSTFFSDLMQLLPHEPPAWWEDLVGLAPQSFIMYKSAAFLQYQLVLSLQNMKGDCPNWDIRTMFCCTRTRFRDLQGNKLDSRQAVPCHIRMLMPIGMAMCLQFALQRHQAASVPHRLCFHVLQSKKDANAHFQIKPRLVLDRMGFYSKPDFVLKDLLLGGVTQQVFQEIGGKKCLKVNLLTLVSEGVSERSSSCNTEYLCSMLKQFQNADKESFRQLGANMLGPSIDDLKRFIEMIDNANNMAPAYKLSKLKGIDVAQYIADGMPVDRYVSGSDYKQTGGSKRYKSSD